MQYINMRPSACARDDSNAEPIHCRIQLQARVNATFNIRIEMKQKQEKKMVIISGEARVKWSLLSCSHIYIPFIKSRLPCFRINMKSPSSFFHVTRGIGLPVARHVNAASSPSCTAMSTDESSFIISGGTVWNTRHIRMNHTKRKRKKML